MTSKLTNLLQGIRRLGCGAGRVVLWIAVIAWAAHLWLRPAQPLWTSAVIPGGTNPIGFTKEGELVTADGDSFYLYQSPRLGGLPSASSTGKIPLLLTTWNLRTGQVVAQSTRSVPLISHMGIVASQNCDTIITREMTGNQSHWKVLDRRTGQQRFPTLPLNTRDFPAISPDGRYAAMNSGWSMQGPSQFYAIIDLTTGDQVAKIPIVGFQTEAQTEKFGAVDASSVLFTADSRELMTFECGESGRWIVFHSMPEGVEVARCPIPEFPKYQSLALSHWASGNLLFRVQSSEYPDFRSDYRAFECVGHQLVRRSEADSIGFQFSWDGDSNYILRGDQWRANVRLIVQAPEPTALRWWNQTMGRIHPLLIINRDFRSFGIVQFVREGDGSPIGVPIKIQGYDGTNFVYRPSPDGQWIVDGGDRLRVYRTPPPEWYMRLPGVLLLLGLGWLVDRRLGTRKPVPQP